MRFSVHMLALVVSSTCVLAHGQVQPNTQSVKQSVIEFTNDLFAKFAAEKSGENLISSPLSIHTVLSMAAYGAGGKTYQQMMQGLRLPESPDRSLQLGFKEMVADLQNVENVTLNIANAMYVATGWAFKTEYKHLTSDIFKSEVAPLDIYNPGEAVRSVNTWVEQKTNKKIKDILAEDTRMILLNAIYFKGNWATKFEKENTKKMLFNVDKNNQKLVPTMHIESDFVSGYSEKLRAQYVVLPYENRDFKMIIFVPKDIDGLGYVEANLKSFNLNRLTQGGQRTQKIDLYLPKFKIESEIDLEGTLQQLGMVDMFGGAANFSGITNESVNVDRIRHKAFIEVNEEGSEAAAATALQIATRLGILDPIVSVDRPFYFVIVHNTVPIFTGHVIEPESEDLEEPNQGGSQAKDLQGTFTDDTHNFEPYPLVPPVIDRINLNPQWSESTPFSRVWPTSASPTIQQRQSHEKLDSRSGWQENPRANSLDTQSYWDYERIREFYEWFTQKGHCPRFICPPITSSHSSKKWSPAESSSDDVHRTWMTEV